MESDHEQVNSGSSDSEEEKNEVDLVQILPYLYLGDAEAAGNKEALKEEGITHIVNCSADEVESAFPDDFKYTGFPIADAIDESIEEYFDDAYNAIAAVKDAKGKVLVFDEDGDSVAPTIGNLPSVCFIPFSSVLLTGCRSSSTVMAISGKISSLKSSLLAPCLSSTASFS